MDQATETEALSSTPPPLPLFTVKNSVRSPHTKLRRKQSSGPNNLKQYLGGGELRVIRGTGLKVTEATLLKHLKEILGKVRRGELQVFAPNGQLLTLEALERGAGMEMPPLPPPVPLPNPPIDSAKNDLPAGGPIAQYPGGDPVMLDPNARPDLLSDAPREQLPPPPAVPTDLGPPVPVAETAPEGEGSIEDAMMDEGEETEETPPADGSPPSLMGGKSGKKNKRK